jgi:hypothetical protein
MRNPDPTDKIHHEGMKAGNIGKHFVLFKFRVFVVIIDERFSENQVAAHGF